MRHDLTYERLRELLHYDPDTGVFTWLVSRGNCHKGTRAGAQRPDGYRQICLDGVLYLESRLAWFYTERSWPEHEIDHRNLDPSVSRWDNLRDATRAQNECNKPARISRYGIKGVRRAKQKVGYEAYLHHHGRHITLGTFPTIEQASAARRLAAEEIYGEFARHE